MMGLPLTADVPANWLESGWLGLWLCALVSVLAGHVTLNVYALNCFLGWPFPRWFSNLVRKANNIWLFALPALVLWTFVRGAAILPDFLELPWLVYLVACAVAGVVAAPLTQLYYWRTHRRPAVLESNHSDYVDVARELGYRPVGRGKHRDLARLPGNQIFQVEFNEKHVHVPGLPAAWEGLTILHLSDLHFKGTPDKAFYQHVAERCQRWQPDLLALTGDIVDSSHHHRWMLPVLGRLRWRTGAFAILGNHDLWYEPALVRRRLRRLGMHVLGNGWTTLTVRDQPLVVVGHEGPWFGPPPNLAECPSGFRLCLSHTPDNIGWARANGINLMLSGHTHGGQIRFPLIGSVYVPSKFSRRYDCGTFHLPPTLLHVSRGLAGQIPVRYRCRPEVTLMVLHEATN